MTAITTGRHNIRMSLGATVERHEGGILNDVSFVDILTRTTERLSLNARLRVIPDDADG